MNYYINKYKKFRKYFFACVLGTLFWLPTMIKSGIVYNFGIGFWGANGHDGIWHIALIESLSRDSWEIPVMSGMMLKNYHIGFDLIAAIIHRLTFIPVSVLYFQIFPLIFSLLIGILAFLFVYQWKKSSLQAIWSVFFIYFGGSFGWIINLIKKGNFDGESMFWAQQSISTLINPPFALSLIFIFFGLIFLIKARNTGNRKMFFLSSIFFGLLVVIKVYAGILLLTGLLAAGLFEMIKNRDLKVFKVFSGSLLISLIIFLPNIASAGSTLIFQPFWFLETMMASPDRLNWPKYYEAMINYGLGGIYHKLILSYFLALIIFLIGNFGTRITGLFYLIGKKNNLDCIDTLVFSVIGLGVAIPMFIIQKGTPWNSIQFFYYSIVFMGIIAGIVVGRLFQKKNKMITYLIALIIFLFTVPTTAATLIFHYIPDRPPAVLPLDEKEALDYLRFQSNGTVLTYPFDKRKADEAVANPPRPLYLYDSTAYVSAYSSKPVFLEDEVNLNITGYDWVNRRKEVEQFYSTENESYAFDFLRNNNIHYIYLLEGQTFSLDESTLGLKLIFHNDTARIYSVIR